MPRKILFLYLFLALTFIAGMWFSTGTMAMYAASHTWNRVLEPCRYLANVDHDHFLATFQFLSGEDQKLWESSVVLRRLLYPLLSYPLMSTLGFHLGGVISSMLIQIVSIFVFLRFIAAKYDHRAALSCALLLSTYPGVMYWIGLPYSYVMIVPCSLLSIILLYKLQDARSLSLIVLLSLGLGVLFLGYDLLPYFGLGAILLMLPGVRKYKPNRSASFLVLPACLAGMLAPSILVLLFFSLVYGISPANANTNIYSVVLMSYFRPGDLSAWINLLTAAPDILLHNFLYSNFLYLPILFLCITGIARIFWRVKFDAVELVLLLSVFAIWTFGNLAPPYDAKWQIRGFWIARLYQPIFAAYLVYIAKVAHHLSQQKVDGESAAKKTIFWILLLTTTVANASIVFGPVMSFRIADRVYYNFYQHSVPNALTLNMERFGKRPLGYCDEGRPHKPGKRNGTKKGKKKSVL